MAVMKKRIEMVEKALDTERRRRITAEATLEDVKRECKAPFIVPALLEAFITVSKLTSEAVGTGR